MAHGGPASPTASHPTPARTSRFGGGAARSEQPPSGGGGGARHRCGGDCGARHSVCLVCDFFYPRLGGVEMHIWSLAQCLLRRGHKVIVVTHHYPDGRKGVRHMTGGLKVYYCPMTPFVDQVAASGTWGSLYRVDRPRRSLWGAVVSAHAAACPAGRTLNQRAPRRALI